MQQPEKPEALPPVPPVPAPAPPAGDRPWQHQVPPPPAVPPGAGPVEMRVTKRLLWVAGAAYPLSNVTRVYTFLATPRRGEATLLFFRRLGIILSVAFTLTILSGLTGIAGEEEAAKTIVKLVWFGALAGLVYFLVQWLAVLAASSHFVLAVETSGNSTAIVTSRDHAHLQQLVGQVVEAIENPEAEFLVHVESLAINPAHYHFGDNVNMYGGSGNTGMVKG